MRIATKAGLALSGLLLMSGPSSSGAACQTLQTINQPESRDAAGRITGEASIIHVVSCVGAGGSSEPMYIYQYLNRPGFRVIRPPDWGHAIGGQDFQTFEQAQAAAATGGQGAVTQPPPQTGCPDGSINLLGVCSQ